MTNTNSKLFQTKNPAQIPYGYAYNQSNYNYCLLELIFSEYNPQKDQT